MYISHKKGLLMRLCFLLILATSYVNTAEIDRTQRLKSPDPEILSNTIYHSCQDWQEELKIAAIKEQFQGHISSWHNGEGVGIDFDEKSPYPTLTRFRFPIAYKEQFNTFFQSLEGDNTAVNEFIIALSNKIAEAKKALTDEVKKNLSNPEIQKSILRYSSLVQQARQLIEKQEKNDVDDQIARLENLCPHFKKGFFLTLTPATKNLFLNLPHPIRYIADLYIKKGNPAHWQIPYSRKKNTNPFFKTK